MADSGEFPADNAQIDFLSELIQTGPLYESPSGQKACAEKIVSRLEHFGWDNVQLQSYTAQEVADDPHYVPVDSFGTQYAEDKDRPKLNAIGVLRAAKPGKTLILNGHYDVEPVTDNEKWQHAWDSGIVADGRVWGRGSTDMLGGLSSQLYVASKLAEDRNSWSGQIIFNAVADEEIGGNGTLASLHEMSRVGLLESTGETSCLIAEPSSGVIALESLGFLHMVLMAKGRARHMAGASPRENILYDMIEVIEGFETSLDTAFKEVNVAAGAAQHTFGKINGGVDAATPMPNIEAEATIFYPVDIEAKALRESLSKVLSVTAPEIDVNFSDFYFDGQRSTDGLLSQALVDTRPSAAVKTGIFPSPCDARLFGHFGIRNVVTYGPGSLANAHSPNEYIDITDIAQYNEHLEAAIRTYLRTDE